MSETPSTPILDDHLHLDPVNGRGVAAAEAFTAVGGTHLLVLNKPSWHYGNDVSDADDFRAGFEHTLDVTRRSSAVLPGRAWAVLGVHPTLISQLIDRGFTPEEARDLMQTGLDVAAEYVASGDALALKSGRPHYEVDDAVWSASNAVMQHAFALGATHDCAVQLHTEGGEEFTEVTQWAADAGMARHRVVKHYAEGRITGPTPSVLADKEELLRAAEAGEPFMMETDFIDDPERPGAVLGPKTVPRRTAWLRDQGYETALEIAHVETPHRVYDIDTIETLE
ncbi:TatD family hydrolase [Halocatena pleomorpha]|uniref:Deoxyribonuclease n=1 Tax=Halocatena pleomorpha TaxID=1785090 RepID=A0A3P3RAN2_9EURY|nr:TatD family hydrolase [Halocatena pleomorpha]RRJ30547.1 deoxyribonuclease [Halocatena pleomorpha]